MTDPVKIVVSSPSTTADRRGSGNGGASAPTSSAPTSSAPAKAVPQPQTSAADQPLRLVVEPTNGGEDYTYKLFDRATGELLMELPREQAAKMSQSPDYAAGQVINAKA